MNKIESKDSRIYVPITSYKANVQHTLSIRSASDEHPMKPRGNHEAHPTQIWKYVAMLVMGLTFGIQKSFGYQLWGNVYFDNTDKQWGEVSLILGKDDGSTAYHLTKLDNCNLWYRWFDYDDYNDAYFFNADWKDENRWDGYDYRPYARVSNLADADKWGPYKQNYNTNAKTGPGQRYYFDGVNNSSAAGGLPLYTATLKVKKSTNGSAYTEITSGAWPAAINLKGTLMSGDASTTQDNIDTNTGADAHFDYIPTSGEVTMTLGDYADGSYEFVGWGTDDDPTETDEEFTYNISEATTYYAFFRTREYGVTFNMKGHGTAVAEQTIYHGGTVSEPAEPSAQGYKFDGWYKEEGCTNEWDFENDVVTANTELFAKWSVRHRVDFVVNGETMATIYRAAGEAFSEIPADNGVMPADPADNTLSSCGANKFVGWSTTDIGGDAITTAPADLFSNASAGEISVSANTTYYAVFGDSIPANATKGLSLARTVMWSEDWTGGLAINNGRPTEPTPSGGYKIGSIITYNMVKVGGDTYVITGNNAGGKTPELMIGKSNSYFSVTGIPSRGARKISLSFKQTAYRLYVDLTGTGYSFSPSGTSVNDNTSGSHEYTILCANDADDSFTLQFKATTTNGVRLDDIVLKVKEDGATNYRTRCPCMTVTSYPVSEGKPFFITSSYYAATRKVRSQDSIRIQGSNLTKNGAVSISGVSSKFSLGSAKNGTITTRSDGTIDTIAYIYYTPDAEDTEDGLDTYNSFTISVAGNGGKDVDVSQTLIGRHLPANFVIAAKSGDTWYALPSNMTTGTPYAIAIAVDNETLPTRVLTYNDNVYTLYGQTTNILNSGKGQYVKLAMHGMDNAPLAGQTDGNTGLGKSSASKIDENRDVNYWWNLAQINTSITNAADAKYNIKVANGNTRNLKLWPNDSGGPRWGFYTYNTAIDEIRLIPLYAEEIEVSGTEWGKDAIAVEANFGEKSVEKVEASVGETSSGKKSVPAAVGGAYFFDLDGTISFVGHAGERLILDWYNSSDVQVGASWLTIPSIKDAGAATTWSTIASTPTLEDIVVVRNPMAVDGTGAKAKRVVLDGGQVEIRAGKELVVAETVRRLTGSGFGATEEEDIAIGSTAGAGLGALVMGSHDGTNKATVNFTTLSSGTSGSSASVSQYLGTPFSDATVLSDWYNSWVYGIQYTEHVIGWARVNNGMDPFKGYAVISADGTNHVYWMQGTLVDSETKTIDGLNYQSGTATNPNNENLLANSWMAPIKINAFEAGDFTNADATIYIFNSGSPDNYAADGGSIGTSAGQYSTYTPGSAEETDVIPAMQSFSVYTSGESASVTLDYNKLVYTPAVNGTTPVANRAPQRRTLGEKTDKLHLYAYGESGYGDMVYLLAREDFENGFENGFDGRKVFGETVAPQMYAMTMDGNMAINCVPTMEGTVLGFRKGSGDSEYTFSFEYEGAETLYLNDLKAQTSTLIGAESSYTFTAAADDDEARFIISATPIGQMPTEVERQKSKVERQKIIIHGNLFIIRDGRMYSAEGSLVK